ncbi:Josephin domain containing protein [Trichuris trichiura]|uniref:Ataxin-3 homolog n=1 Tax=Trichuris trichiura TaxID=36087 RepID=A0A077Z7E3_TRITR|nr:Josephin domain containing protein [Trichuris trichiura]
MLCAQHALNNLLQGAYFSAVDLAEIARKLDELERSVLGTDLSLNVNDDGYFSVQVISEALKVFDLRLVGLCDFQARNIGSLTCSAFICNFENHWFTLRRINGCWFNLNSLNSGPTIISDCHLELYLAQLAAEGYTVFVVEGQLPPCPAENSVVDCGDIEDVVNVDSDAFQPKPFNNKIVHALSPTDYVDESDEDLLKALIASREAADHNDRSLQKALMENVSLPAAECGTSDAHINGQASIDNTDQIRHSDVTPDVFPSAEEVRRKREAFLRRLEEAKKK